MSSRSPLVMCLIITAAAMLNIGPAYAEADDPRTRAPEAREVVSMLRSIAPPMGLLDLCDREPVICAGPSESISHVARSVSEARGLAWQELLRGAGNKAQPGSVRQPRAARVPTPESGDGNFLGGLVSDNVQPASNEFSRAEAINAALNRSIAPVSDTSLYGRPDVWTVPRPRGGARLAGDCEDYVLAKREALLRAGFSSDRLSIALARTPQGEDHAVLLLAFPDGDYVLDNRDSRVLHWSQARLVWQARQRPGDLLQWIRL